MPTTLYYDTETTKILQKNAPIEEQPHIVQLAAILIDDDLGEIASINVIVKPDGWEVPEEAAQVHGITTEKAEKFGIPLIVALASFSNLCKVSDLLVAHNNYFDLGVLGFEYERLGKPNIMKEKNHFCTMNATTDLCRIPGKFGKYKWPKLIEAHEMLLGETFDGAHDALVDVRACYRVHKYLIENNLV